MEVPKMYFVKFKKTPKCSYSIQPYCWFWISIIWKSEIKGIFLAVKTVAVKTGTGN